QIAQPSREEEIVFEVLENGDNLGCRKSLLVLAHQCCRARQELIKPGLESAEPGYTCVFRQQVATQFTSNQSAVVLFFPVELVERFLATPPVLLGFIQESRELLTGERRAGPKTIIDIKQPIIDRCPAFLQEP